MYVLGGYIIHPIMSNEQENFTERARNSGVDPATWRLLGDGHLDQTKFNYRNELSHTFLDLLKAMNLIRVNRVSDDVNGTEAGTTSDLVSLRLQFLPDEKFAQVIKFIEENPKEAKEVLIKSGGFKEKKQSWWKKMRFKTK